MRATVMFGAGDVRIEDVLDAAIVEPTDAVVRVTRACICGSDLRPYNQMERTETGEDHWHGAAPNRFMTHLAMQQVDDEGNAKATPRPGASTSATSTTVPHQRHKPRR